MDVKLVEKLDKKDKDNRIYKCTYSSNEDVNNLDKEVINNVDKYKIIAVPDIYLQSALNDAYKCLDYIGYFK